MCMEMRDCTVVFRLEIGILHYNRDPVNRAYTGCYSRCLLTLGNIGILCLLYVALAITL